MSWSWRDDPEQLADRQEALMQALALEGDDPFAWYEPTAELMDRLWAKVDRSGDGCWTWRGKRNTGGYGQISVNRRLTLVHRITFESVNGPIPDRLTIDHLCRNRLCVNPSHLEAVTQAENTRRQPLRTHCPNGHPYDDENTRYERIHGETLARRCHACRQIQRRKYRHRGEFKEAA